MTEEEFIAEAKRQGKSRTETLIKFEKLKAEGVFNSKGKSKPATKKTEPDKYSALGSDYENFMAGLGKSIYDTSRGIGNLISEDLVSDEEIEESRRLDAELMDSGFGMAGNMVGHAGQMLAPAGVALKAGKYIPQVAKYTKPIAGVLTNPQTYKAGAMVGAGYAGLQPATSGTERLGNMTGGAVGGGLGVGVGRMAQAGLQGAKSVVQPLYKSGKEKIVSRYLSDHILDKPQALRSLNNIKTNVKGSPVTSAEAMMDDSISGLTRSEMSQNPLFNAQMGQVAQTQNNARVKALEGLVQPSLKSARDAMARTATRSFRGVEVDINPLRKMIKGMMKQSQMDDTAMKVLRYVDNKIVDDMDLSTLYSLRKTLTTDKLSKMDGFDAMTVINIRDRIDDIASQQSGIYKDYLKRYAEMSVPDNQNAVVKEVIKRSTYPMQNPAEEVVQGANPLQLSPAKLAGAIKQDSKLVKSATGFRKSKGLKGTLTRKQNETINAVNDDLTRSSKAMSKGKAFGSNTAQNLASRNIANRSLGTLVPESLVDYAKNGLAGRTANVVYGGSDDAMREMVNEALINPELMKHLLSMDVDGVFAQSVMNALSFAGSSTGTGISVGLLGQEN